MPPVPGQVVAPIRRPKSPSRRGRAERPHKADQIGLPHRGVIMGEMPMCLVAVGDQHVAAVMNLLHRALNRAQLGRVASSSTVLISRTLALILGRSASGL